MEPHILLVDADASAAHVTAAIVQRIAPEATLEIESSPGSGWLSAQRRTPDVLIIDPSPHGSAGALLIQLCKEEWPDLRVIVLASAPTPPLRARMERLGVDLYLEKPTPLAVLGDRLAQALRGGTPARRLSEIPRA